MLINFKNRASPTPTSNLERKNSFDYTSNLNKYHLTNQSDSISSESSYLTKDDVFICDEQHEDFVYQVTIKKVYNKQITIDDNNNDINDKSKVLYGTYKPLGSSFFSYINESNNLEQSIYSTSSNNTNNSNNNNNKDGLIYTRVKVKHLKYATLPKFIEHLTNQETGQLDSNLVQIFLATYRTFTDTTTALKMLQNRFEQIVPASLEMTEDVRLEHLKSFRSIIYMWVEYYSEDFVEPPDYTNLKDLNRFVQKHFSLENNLLYSPEILHLIKSRLDSFEEESTTNIKISNQFDSNSYNTIVPSKQKSSHRRSCSNFGPISPNSSDACNSLTNCSTGQIFYLNKDNVSNLQNLSKSQININSAAKSQQPIFTIFKKSSSNSNIVLVNDLMDANFMSIDSVYFAEQLTYIDKGLFQKICAHLCLGGVWSTRYQKNKNDVNKSGYGTPILADKFATIGAFIDQFNIVSFIVQATILENTKLKPNERAKIIRKWIEIAQACRNLKNFSSLNAIVQGLNTQCVSRLEKTWNEVSSEIKLQFQELTDMFSEDQNQNIFRQILLKDLKRYARIFENDNFNINNNNNTIDLKNEIKYSEFCNNIGPTSLNNNLPGFYLNSHIQKKNLEGTAKYADIDRGINATLGRKYKENIRKQMKKQEPLGTIPFLGTFLKDLEYINAQNPSKIEKGLINVMQKRKEFEIIAQIKLLQQAAQLYNIIPNPDFNVWLHKQTVYSEEQNYKLSRIIEPRNENDNNKLNPTSRCESVDSLNSKASSNNSKQNKTHSRNNSNGIISEDSYSNNLSENQNNKTILDLKSFKLTQSSNLKVRVNIEANTNQNTVLYKTIYVKDSDRTKDVKRAILEKFLQNPDTCDKYTLVQLLTSSEINNSNSIQIPQKELIINDNCNVFYAAKNVPVMQFVLRPKNSNIFSNTSNTSSSILNKNVRSNNTFSYESEGELISGKKLGTNSISNNNRSTSSNGNKNFNDLPPQSPNHHHQKSYSWNKFFIKK